MEGLLEIKREKKYRNKKTLNKRCELESITSYLSISIIESADSMNRRWKRREREKTKRFILIAIEIYAKNFSCWLFVFFLRHDCNRDSHYHDWQIVMSEGTIGFGSFFFCFYFFFLSSILWQSFLPKRTAAG